MPVGDVAWYGLDRLPASAVIIDGDVYDPSCAMGAVRADRSVLEAVVIRLDPEVAELRQTVPCSACSQPVEI